jgi:hypothetical protein
VEWLEEFWSDMLSEEPLRIVAAFTVLDAEEKVAVHNHLVQMTTEEGWAEGQRDSALAALAALADNDNADLKN